MIPKLVHFIWVGPSPLSPEATMCLGSWKAHCPDYKFILWNEKSILQANTANKDLLLKCVEKGGYYAFFSDIARIDLLEKFGGIYADTDYYCLNSMDNLLNDKLFVAFEDHRKKAIGTAIIGAQKGNQLLIDTNLEAASRLKANNYSFNEVSCGVYCFRDVCSQRKDFTIYDSHKFYPLSVRKKKSIEVNNINYLKELYKDAYGFHLWNYSWRKKRGKYKYKL